MVLELSVSPLVAQYQRLLSHVTIAGSILADIVISQSQAKHHGYEVWDRTLVLAVHWLTMWNLEACSGKLERNDKANAAVDNTYFVLDMLEITSYVSSPFNFFFDLFYSYLHLIKEEVEMWNFMCIVQCYLPLNW